MAVHDPVDPQQRKQLETYIPGLTESKLSVVQMQNEQRLFIAQMQLKAMGLITKQEFFRLVMLIGGGEPLISHPIDEIYKSRPAGMTRLQEDFSDAVASISAVSGLWSFLTSAQPLQDVDTAQGYQITDNSFKAREFIALTCLQHFPRLITGAYDPLSTSDKPRVKRDGDAAERLVQMCERAVQKTRVPIGYYANQMLRAPAPNQKSQFVNRNFFGTNLNNPDGSGVPAPGSYF
jgi:hypothetical protein